MRAPRVSRTPSRSSAGLKKRSIAALSLGGSAVDVSPPPEPDEQPTAAAPTSPPAAAIPRSRRAPAGGGTCRCRRLPAPGAGRAADRGRADQHAGGDDPEQSSCAGGERQFTISTGVPSGNTFESFVISSLSMRMQPWVTLFPSTEASLLPWTPTSASPPLNSLRASECADRPYANGPYTVLGS